MNLLIGKYFRRNKYGLSSWIKQITNVRIQYEYDHSNNTIKPIFIIHDGRFTYKLDEIIIYIEHQGETQSVSSHKESERICPKCGCQIYDPFTGIYIIHDATECSGKWSDSDRSMRDES